MKDLDIENRTTSLDAKARKPDNKLEKFLSSGLQVCEVLLLMECLCPFKGSLIQGQPISLYDLGC